MRYHPWRVLRSLPSWSLRVLPLPPGLLGVTDHDTRTITIADGLTQAQRRSTLAHELGHVERGPVPEALSALEERAVDILAARRLIPLTDLVDACRWTRDVHELADELWVDVATVETRLRHLHPSEAAHIRRLGSDHHP